MRIGVLTMERDRQDFEYDVALSFAGEDRSIAESLASMLSSEGVRVFYDRYEQGKLWGKDLYQHLQAVYRDSARFCVIIISAAYAQRLWTRHELQQVQARAFQENSEYILPLRVDDTELPGLNPTTAYLDLREYTLEFVRDTLLKKLSEFSDREGEHQFRDHWVRFFPVQHVGPVWIQLLQRPEDVGRKHEMSLRWGPWMCKITFQSAANPVCLTTSKGPDSTSVPVFIEVTPPCHVSSSISHPACEEVIDVNYGWRRVWRQ
jgi:hypothetical protein